MLITAPTGPVVPACPPISAGSCEQEAPPTGRDCRKIPVRGQSRRRPFPREPAYLQAIHRGCNRAMINVDPVFVQSCIATARPAVGHALGHAGRCHWPVPIGGSWVLSGTHGVAVPRKIGVGGLPVRGSVPPDICLISACR